MTSMIIQVKMTRTAKTTKAAPAIAGQAAFSFDAPAAQQTAFGFTDAAPAADRYEAREHAQKG